jgi:hypothetical protein
MVMDSAERMEILAKAVVNYRQTLKKQNQVIVYND